LLGRPLIVAGGADPEEPVDEINSEPGADDPSAALEVTFASETPHDDAGERHDGGKRVAHGLQEPAPRWL
jgi:hypothetical protein